MEGFNKRTDEQYHKRPSYPSILINDKKQGSEWSHGKHAHVNKADIKLQAKKITRYWKDLYVRKVS